jgi:hypothetical protein
LLALLSLVSVPGGRWYVPSQDGVQISVHGWTKRRSFAGDTGDQVSALEELTL